MSAKRKKHRNYLSYSPISRLALMGVFVVAILVQPLLTHAAQLTIASVAAGDSRPSAANVTFTFTASNVTLSTIRCIREVYADTSGGSIVPTGMSTAAATFDTTNSTFMPTPGAWTFTRPANGTLQLVSAAGEIPASAAARKLVFGAITNGSTLSLTVDPTLSFTVNAVAGGQACNGATSTQASTATTIPFGTVTSAANSIVCQDLQVATNATNGFTVYSRYTSKPQSGANLIADTSGTNTAPAAFSAPGTEAYGYTTNDSTLGTGTANRFSSNLWAAMTNTNSEVAFEAAGVTSTLYRIGHQVGISSTTRPGTYVTTIIYTCTPVY